MAHERTEKELQGPWNKKDTVLISAILLAAALMRIPAVLPAAVGGDGANYVRLAWSLRYASTPDVTAGVLHSFGYSIFIWLGSFLFDDLDKVGFGVSIFFGILTLVPFYILGRLLFGTAVAAIASIAFAFFQPHILVSQSPESDATYIFWLLLAVYLFVRGILYSKPTYYYAVVGALFGFVYIIRPEAQIIFASLSAAFVLTLKYRQSSGIKKIALLLLVLFISFFTVNLPKLAWMHKATGYWELDGRKNFTLNFLDYYQPNYFKKTNISIMRRGYEESMFGLSARGELNFTEQHSFLKWLADNPKYRLMYYIDNVKLSLKNISTHVIILLLLTVWAFIQASKADRERILLLLAMLVPVLLVPFFYTIGRGSYYARPGPEVAYVPSLILIAAFSLVAFLKNFGEKKAKLAFLLLLLLWSSQAMFNWSIYRDWGKEPGADRYALTERLMGEILDKDLPKNIAVMTRSWGISRYCKREMIMMPHAAYLDIVDYARRKNVDFIIVGGITEWRRPSMNFLLPPDSEEAHELYKDDLEFYGYCFAEFEPDGRWVGYFSNKFLKEMNYKNTVSVFRLKTKKT